MYKTSSIPKGEALQTMPNKLREANINSIYSALLLLLIVVAISVTLYATTNQTLLTAKSGNAKLNVIVIEEITHRYIVVRNTGWEEAKIDTVYLYNKDSTRLLAVVRLKNPLILPPKGVGLIEIPRVKNLQHGTPIIYGVSGENTGKILYDRPVPYYPPLLLAWAILFENSTVWNNIGGGATAQPIPGGAMALFSLVKDGRGDNWTAIVAADSERVSSYAIEVLDDNDYASQLNNSVHRVELEMANNGGYYAMSSFLYHGYYFLTALYIPNPFKPGSSLDAVAFSVNTSDKYLPDISMDELNIEDLVEVSSACYEPVSGKTFMFGTTKIERTNNTSRQSVQFFVNALAYVRKGLRGYEGGITVLWWTNNITSFNSADHVILFNKSDNNYYERMSCFGDMLFIVGRYTYQGDVVPGFIAVASNLTKVIGAGYFRSNPRSPLDIVQATTVLRNTHFFPLVGRDPSSGRGFILLVNQATLEPVDAYVFAGDCAGIGCIPVAAYLGNLLYALALTNSDGFVLLRIDPLSGDIVASYLSLTLNGTPVTSSGVDIPPNYYRLYVDENQGNIKVNLLQVNGTYVRGIVTLSLESNVAFPKERQVISFDKGLLEVDIRPLNVSRDSAYESVVKGSYVYSMGVEVDYPTSVAGIALSSLGRDITVYNDASTQLIDASSMVTARFLEPD